MTCLFYKKVYLLKDKFSSCIRRWTLTTWWKRRPRDSWAEENGAGNRPQIWRTTAVLVCLSAKQMNIYSSYILHILVILFFSFSVLKSLIQSWIKFSWNSSQSFHNMKISSMWKVKYILLICTVLKSALLDCKPATLQGSSRTCWHQIE